jgi:hypothetical protein
MAGDWRAARYYLRTANRRVRAALHSLWDNEDELTVDLAKNMLRTEYLGPS